MWGALLPGDQPKKLVEFCYMTEHEFDLFIKGVFLGGMTVACFFGMLLA
jgi:hypothetical protein